MDQTQREAWSSLKPKEQDEYFSTGRVSVGKRPKLKKSKPQATPIQDASVQEILQIVKKEDEKWDFKSIDWNIT